MKIDHLSSCHQPQQGVSGGDALLSGKKEANLPKDVLEALEEGDLEEALFLLRQYQQASNGGIFPDWFFFRTLNNIISALTRPQKAQPLPPKKKVQTAPKLLPALKMRLQKLIAYPIALQKLLQKGTEALLRPLVRTTVTLYHAALKPVEKYVAAPIRVAAKAVASFGARRKAALKEKFVVVKETYLRVREKVVELRERIEEYSKPVKEWLSRKVNHFLDNSHWVKQALGAQVVHVAKVADVVVNVIAYVTVPFQFAADQLHKPFQWLVKKAERFAHFFKEARNWTKKQLLKWEKKLSKGMLILFQATRKALSLLRKWARALARLLRWLYNRALEKAMQWL